MPTCGAGVRARPACTSCVLELSDSTPHGQAPPALRTITGMTVQSASVSLLEVDAVTFLRHDQPVFAPQSFRLCAGELVWVEGDNGSGKTTLLRVLAGLLHAGTGTLHWRGRALERDDSAGEILYIGHQLGLKADLTA